MLIICLIVCQADDSHEMPRLILYDDDGLAFYVFHVPFNISRQYKGDNERICEMKQHIVMN